MPSNWAGMPRHAALRRSQRSAMSAVNQDLAGTPSAGVRPKRHTPYSHAVTSLNRCGKNLWMAEGRGLKGGRGAASVAQIGGMREQARRQSQYAASVLIAKFVSVCGLLGTNFAI